MREVIPMLVIIDYPIIDNELTTSFSKSQNFKQVLKLLNDYMFMNTSSFQENECSL